MSLASGTKLGPYEIVSHDAGAELDGRAGEVSLRCQVSGLNLSSPIDLSSWAERGGSRTKSNDPTNLRNATDLRIFSIRAIQPPEQWTPEVSPDRSVTVSGLRISNPRYQLSVSDVTSSWSCGRLKTDDWRLTTKSTSLTKR